MPFWQGLAVEQLTREHRLRWRYPDYYGNRGFALLRRTVLAYAESRHRRQKEHYRETKNEQSYGETQLQTTGADDSRNAVHAATDMHVLFIANRDPRKRYRRLPSA